MPTPYCVPIEAVCICYGKLGWKVLETSIIQAMQYIYLYILCFKQCNKHTQSAFQEVNVTMTFQQHNHTAHKLQMPQIQMA